MTVGAAAAIIVAQRHVQLLRERTRWNEAVDALGHKAPARELVDRCVELTGYDWVRLDRPHLLPLLSAALLSPGCDVMLNCSPGWGKTASNPCRLTKQCFPPPASPPTQTRRAGTTAGWSGSTGCGTATPRHRHHPHHAHPRRTRAHARATASKGLEQPAAAKGRRRVTAKGHGCLTGRRSGSGSSRQLAQHRARSRSTLEVRRLGLAPLRKGTTRRRQ